MISPFSCTIRLKIVIKNPENHTGATRYHRFHVAPDFCSCCPALFADHDVQDHVVGVLHADGADAAEVPDGLFYVFFDYSVVLGDAYSFTGQHC